MTNKEFKNLNFIELYCLFGYEKLNRLYFFKRQKIITRLEYDKNENYIFNHRNENLFNKKKTKEEEQIIKSVKGE